MTTNRRRALVTGVVLFAIALPSGTALAASIGSTKADVASLSGAEANVLEVLHSYNNTPGWKAQFRAAIAAQGSAIAKVDNDLFPRPTAKPVGATISLQTTQGVPLTVTLKQVIDPARAALSEKPPSGMRFVAAKFTVTDRSASQDLTDSADDNASLVGSNNQVYSPYLATASGCTNFDNGQYRLGPKESATGCVMFQVPAAVGVAEVKWTTNSGFGNWGAWKVK